MILCTQKPRFLSCLLLKRDEYYCQQQLMHKESLSKFRIIWGHVLQRQSNSPERWQTRVPRRSLGFTSLFLPPGIPHDFCHNKMLPCHTAHMDSQLFTQGFKVSQLVSWCFEPSQPQRITSGLNTNFTLSLSYLFHKSSYHKSIFFSLFIFHRHSTQEPASSRVTYFILRAYTGTGVSRSQRRKKSGEVWKKCR